MAQLNKLETKNLRLVSYDFGHKYLLPHATRSFENAFAFHKRLFDYNPSEKVTILIQDFGDFGNGGATAVPVNSISMGVSPFSYTFETSPAAERIFSLMNHELVHVTALDNSSRRDRFFRWMFCGKVLPDNENPVSALFSWYSAPRRYSPRWYHEGIASYVETWMGGGVGLALGSYDEMVFRTRVLEGAHLYSAQGLESEGTTTDFQGKTNSYLYGTRFMGYLADTYGPDRIIEWVKRKDGSSASYSSQFKRIFGKPLTEGWADWIEFEKRWQKSNLDSIRKNPVTEYKDLTDFTLGSVSFPQLDRKNNKVYIAVNYPGVVPHLASLDLKTGKLEKLHDIKGAALFYVASLAWDPETESIFYTTDNDEWRDLCVYEVKTGVNRRLQRDFRTGDIAFNRADKSIWGVKHLNGMSTIVRIPQKNKDHPEKGPYSDWEQKLTLPYGSDIFDLDVSPDGSKLSAAVSDFRGNQSLLIYHTETMDSKNMKVDTVFNFEVSSPQSFRFTDDGQFLYGVSYYSGVSNIYRVNLSNMDISPMTNSLTGVFRPLVLDDQNIFAFRFCSDGFRPVTIPNKVCKDVSAIEFFGNKTVAKYPILRNWQLSAAEANKINVDSIKTGEGKYKPLQLMRLNYAYPIVVGYKNFIGLGYSFNLGDPLGFNSIDFNISYTPKSMPNKFAPSTDKTYDILADDELIHASLFAKFQRVSISASFNNADFYDLFGPTRYSRKGIISRIEYTKSLVYDLPRRLDFTIGGGGYYGLQGSPFFQRVKNLASGNEEKKIDRNLYMNIDGTLTYTNLRSSLGAVDAEKGIRTSVRNLNSYSAGNLFSSFSGVLDLGFQLPVKHMSFWLRNSAGTSLSSEYNPFTRVGFGAFGNNYIDYQSSRRYRGTYAFPGIGFNEEKSIVAKDFVKTMAELVLPPIRFRHLGGLNLYSNWMQFSVFSSALVVREPTRNKLYPSYFPASEAFVNVGSQLDMKIVLFSLLESTLSIGYAEAVDVKNTEQRYKEFMVSLKLLR